MATVYWQLEHEYITVAQPHDLIVRVVEEDVLTDGTKVPAKVVEFKVVRAVLASASTFFAAKLADAELALNSPIDLKGERGFALKLWFDVLHMDNRDLGDDCFLMDFSQIWTVVQTGQKFGFDFSIPRVKTWFGGWYDTSQNFGTQAFDYRAFQQLLMPCYVFDYAPGFAAATKYLVYHAMGTITERKAEGFETRDLGIDPEIIHQLNNAKQRLKTVLHRTLYGPILNLFKKGSCNCRAVVLFSYEQALMQTGIWPIELNSAHTNMSDIIRALEKFIGVPLATCGHVACSFSMWSVVRFAKDGCRHGWDGLCLDCMARSKNANSDAVYWVQGEQGGVIDRGCRIRHGQSTWFFSFTGDTKKMIEWKKNKRMAVNEASDRGHVRRAQPGAPRGFYRTQDARGNGGAAKTGVGARADGKNSHAETSQNATGDEKKHHS